jgi:RHH-type proline utilization regulon transcriptional repressor/proline dehydrogenase/delta 1-pyrroline-5-carboxylate dehydrogenase
LASLLDAIDRPADSLDEATREAIRGAVLSYDDWWAREFSVEHDHFRLLGQDNIRRYLSFREVRVRCAPEDGVFEVYARVAAARVTGARVIVSRAAEPPDGPDLAHLEACTESWAAGIEFVEESDETLAGWIRALAPHAPERLRYAAPGRVPGLVREAAAEAGIFIADEPVEADGRIELLWNLREQSVSCDYHRYGHLGARGSERRREPS